jgi:adenosylcobinamide-phosphate synthase
VVAALRLVERAMLMWLVALLVFAALGVTTGS